MIDDSSNLNDKIKATLEKISALAVRTECNPRGPVEEFRWLSESVPWRSYSRENPWISTERIWQAF